MCKRACARVSTYRYMPISATQNLALDRHYRSPTERARDWSRDSIVDFFSFGAVRSDFSDDTTDSWRGPFRISRDFIR